MATATNTSATNNPEIDGLLSNSRWTGTITYSFPDSPSDYAASYFGNNEPLTSGFSSAPVQMQQAVTYAVALINSYTNANIQYAGTNGADIMVAQSPAANPTSYAYYPSNAPSGGDVWFGTAYNYSLASLGNYYFATALHELGHAVGLKHSQETGGVANVAVPSAHDDSEFTIMSYRSYVGGPLTGYTNEAYGFPQTYMANDILALQTLYGANFNTNSGNTVYSWSASTGQMFINGVAQLAPGGGAGGSSNRIFETVWDGNGIDTYDLSNYTTGVSINLNPGASSITSSTQLAYLGNGHYAQGNIFNAYLYNNDARSYIDNAIGGSGNDSLTGNVIANSLYGGGGNDTLSGGGGNDILTGGTGVDVLIGGDGADRFVFAAGDSSAASGQHDRISDFVSGTDHIDLSGFDAISSTGSYDQFKFIATAAFDGAAGELNYFYNSSTGVTTLQGDTNGDGAPDFAIDLTGNISISLADLIGVYAVPVVIESLGNTSLTVIGNNYALNPVGGGTGPLLKYGSAVTVGQYGAWTFIGAEQISGGYEVALSLPGSDQYTVWNTDVNGNVVSNGTGGIVSGSSDALRSLESSFQQDLNGDGVIGIPSTVTVIEAYGNTSLAVVGNNYALNPSGGGTGPLLKYGSVITVGQFGAWTFIGAEQISGGYEVALHLTGSDQYTVWNTDTNGNVVSNGTGGIVSSSSDALRSLEPSFQQDLNGDGVIGIPSTTTVIEAYGNTSLAVVGNNYALNPSGGGTGPLLKYGSVITVGQYGAWTFIGAEQISGGYEVALHLTGSDQYTVWNTDTNGNVVSNGTGGIVSGSSDALRSLEPSFQQDLNGDGVIGIPSTVTVIEAFGNTSLTVVGNNYALNPSGGGTGPLLKYGSAVTVGQYGAWTFIGAEQISGGYEVALHLPGSDQYTVWNTDTNGNVVSNGTGGIVSGASTALKSLEPSFQQDLNGDAAIGASLLGYQASDQARHNAFVFDQSIASALRTDYFSPAGGWDKSTLQRLDDLKALNSEMMHAISDQLYHPDSDSAILHSINSSASALVQVDWRLFEHSIVQ